MTADPPIEPIRRKFTVDELCEWFKVPPEPSPEPGHVMTHAQFQRIQSQKIKMPTSQVGTYNRRSHDDITVPSTRMEAAMTKPKHGRHEARIANLKALVTEFGKRNLMKDDISFMFGFSPSGARSYAAELVSHEIIFVCDRIKAHRGRAGEPVYQLSADSSAVASFLIALDTSAPKRPKKVKVSQESRMAGRHLHILADDERFAVRVSRDQPKPDPFALDPNFFKPSADFCERRSEPRPEPVRLTGFAALTVRFERKEPDIKAARAVMAKRMARDLADDAAAKERARDGARVMAEAFASDGFVGRFERRAG